MQQLGFGVPDPTLKVQSDPNVDLPTGDAVNSVRISPSLADARQFGYSKPAPATPLPIGGYQKKPSRDDPFYQQPDSYQSRYAAALGEAQTVTLSNGATAVVPQNGCRLKTDKQIFGDMTKYYAAVTALFAVATEPSQQVLSSPALRTVSAAWASCMHGRGYSYSSPNQLPSDQDGDIRAEAGDVAGKAHEIAVAVADASCADQTGIRQVTQTAWQTTFQTYLQGHETDYVSDEQLFKASLSAATKLIR